MRHKRVRLAAAVVPVALLLGSGCGGGGDDEGAEVFQPTSETSASTATSSNQTSTTTAPVTTASSGDGSEAGGPCWRGGSSPATYDESGGTYAVYVTEVDVAARRLGFDVIQFLVGEDADVAYHAEVPDDPGPVPNDYYILNRNPLVREAPVAAAVTVRLVRLASDGDADVDAGTWEELPTYLADYAGEPGRLSYNPFWVTVDDGTVTAICEQYVP